MLFVLLVYMELNILEPNIMSDHIHAFLDDPKGPEHIKDPRLKQFKRRF